MQIIRHLFGSRAREAIFALLILAPVFLAAQTPPVLPPGGLIQLQVAQPAVDLSAPVTATAQFDPPMTHPGQPVFYRASVGSTESSISWPDTPPAPAELFFGPKRSGQITEMQGGKFRTVASFVYEVHASVAGHYTAPAFSVMVAGTPVQVPAASLDVAPGTGEAPAPRRLILKSSATNVFLGQQFRVRVILPAGPGNQIEALREIEFSGDGLMTDKSASRMAIEPLDVNGQMRPAFVAEMAVTPIAAGPLRFLAQGFTAGREFTAPISIRGQISLPGAPTYVLLVSDPIEINVRPLPVDGVLPGFTGAIGRFIADPPRLSTNRLQVGEPLELKLGFRPQGDLTRFAPPDAPSSRDWQIIADPPPSTSFTLIPLTDDAHETPAIPFCSFDPETGKYVDLTIPALDVTVTGASLPVELAASDDEGKPEQPMKLSSLAATPGMTARSLKPLQFQPWFVAVQLAPLLAFFALWQWDRRRRFLEAHPEIVRRAQARRALRREKRELQKAAVAGDAPAYVQHAARALSIAVAPHFPANPRALVCGDVLAQLEDAEQNGQSAETVKMVFAAADAQFALVLQEQSGLLALRPGVDSILQKLEERL